MTVVYKGTLGRVLFKWRGSLYKAIGLELIIFLILFMALNLCYRFAMSKEQMLTFESMVAVADLWMQRIPLEFFLGFYVSYILDRWWNTVIAVPIVDKPLMVITTYFRGQSHEARSVRQTIARWLNLHCVLSWRVFASKIHKRFPDDTHLIQSGLMSPKEYDLYRKTTSEYGKNWQPVQWCNNLIAQKYEEGRLEADAVNQILEAIYDVNEKNFNLQTKEWILPPLIYTQLATLATYGYFALCLLARQTVRQDTLVSPKPVDLYIPVVTILEFIFYNGWLKVADVFREPFGEQDDDFDINFWLDRNIHTSAMIIEEVGTQELDALEAPLWRSVHPQVPHTRASFLVRDGIPKGRLDGRHYSEFDREIIPLEKKGSNFARYAYEKSRYQAEVARHKVSEARDKYGNLIHHRKSKGVIAPEEIIYHHKRRHSFEV